MAERLIINLSTGEETTVALTAEEIAADNAVATEIAKTKYIGDRQTYGTVTYTGMSEQLDQLYRDVAAGKFGADAKTGEWFVGITSVKTLNPKPS